MAIDSTLSALLETEDEPTPAVYKSTLEKFIDDQEQISSLTDTNIQEDVLLQLTTRSHRLVRFFSDLRAKPKSLLSSHIAAGIATFLVQILPPLHQLLSPTEIRDLLTPALEICLAPSQPPPLRELASVLAGCGRLLEHLASDPNGSSVLRPWICKLGTSSLNAPILELWIERLVELVGSCKASHDFAQTLQQCGTLRNLKSQLRNLEARHSEELSGPRAPHGSLPLSSMTQLREDDKKSRTGGKEPKTDTPALDENTKRDLKSFDLPDPQSWAALRNVIERLEGDATQKALLSVVTHFPCKLCIQCMGSSPQIPDARTIDESTGTVSNLQIEILGKALGVWQILLSVQALRSLQEMSSQGLVSPAGEKLRDLASGDWKGTKKATLAGTDAQRKRLKVPLFTTECGRNKILLWQADMGTTSDLQVPEQVIKVWEVGDLSKMDKVFDSVALLQRSYSPECIRRCCQRPSAQDEKVFPARFEDPILHSAVASVPLARLDVKTVHQSTIDMANKFYALTEPIFRAILANDLSAEFPFDLSKEEARVISHFQTASLILGRSGTGKTTCLIFKMVGKYLTSKAVMGQTPVKQVLLTKSSFLANKLRAYTRGLIQTLESKSVDSKSNADGENPALMMLRKDLGEGSVSTLGEHSFPLVLTFDEFLRILENTAEALDRKTFSRPEVPLYHNSTKFVESAKAVHWQKSQLVDFRTFKLDYWPRFPQKITKRLGVNLVFAEIMGVIKGSASSGQCLTPLSRQEYLDRSCRLAPIFVTEDDRALVYDIFERYEEMKEEHQDVDNVDRVVKLISAVRQSASLKQLLESAFDEVYIDEVQDQRCVDIQLLLQFIKDSRGLHLAGDTAQAISQDSTFRFSDIKAIIYEHFAAASAYTNQNQLARTTMFTLSKNYRSHQGILALASLVMAMMWKGFPETVDKLDPEVGSHNGPKPVLFLGCDAGILRTSNVGLVKLSDRVADFGAEQVILVRDEAMKTRLQGKIGDIALILTILDSKGMEFDDVIIWDFFTSSPDPSGVRCLSALITDARPAFDGRKHSGMCSELKHLYVAITRARTQLFFLESSEKATLSIVELLTSGSSGSLVDVTRPYEGDFPKKLQMLRPGTSVDPVRWSLRGDELLQRGNYEAAFTCFKKAKNDRGEKIANGKLWEAKGSECLARNDVQGFTSNFEAAIELFRETKMIGDAVKLLEKLTRFGDAAELWLSHNQNVKAAAPLFAKAGLYERASNCHHNIGNYSEAAAILRQGEKYNEMVSYLDRNRENIPANTLRSHSVLCKLLLKQKRLKPENRKYAFDLLGSSAEQEACFIEYGMDEELAEVYSSQQRHEDLFHLHSRRGELEEALNLTITNGLLDSTDDFFELQTLSLLDYVWVGHLEKNRQQDSVAAYKLPSGYITPKVIFRAEQWESTYLVYSSQHADTRQHFVDMDNTVAKTLLTLRDILNTTAFNKVKTFDGIPFKMMQEAVKFAKDLAVNKKSDALRVLLLLAGVWKSDSTQDRYVLLPWSPLRKIVTSIAVVDALKVAKKWFLDGLVSAIFALDTAARELWKLKWLIPCVHFLTMKICPRQRNREDCHWKHELVSEQDCSQTFEDLLRVNGIFCDLAVIYYHRAFNKTFQEKYLGIKRHWLERLLRELTHLSAVEQKPSIIIKKQAELCLDKKHTTISISLEELLYFRLVREWSKRNDFTSLLEQMQRAQAFGTNLQNRVLRALSSRLHMEGRGPLQHHLALLNSLERDLGSQDASAFQSNLSIFLRNLDNIDVQAFSTLHALTAVFEYLAAYCILKTCDSACVLSQAWIDLHVPRFNDAIHSVEQLQWFDSSHKYHQCLMGLTKAFCGILRRLNDVPQPGITQLCSGKPHHPLLIRQRNAELVAIVVANLAPAEPRGFSQFWREVKEVFEYDFVRAYHLRSSTPAEITSKLAFSFSKYNEKDALIVITKDQKKKSPFSKLEHQLGVGSDTFDHICPPTMTPATTRAPADNSLSTATDSTQEEYTKTEIEAAGKIQHVWRSCFRKIKNRRLYMLLPEAPLIAHFIALGAECPANLTFIDGVALRDTLISKGVEVSLRMAVARDTLSRLQKDAMTCVEKVGISTGLFESVDDVLHRNSQVEALLRKADEKMSDECMVGVVQMGVLTVLKEVMKTVEEIVTQAEHDMLETRKKTDTVSRSCT